MAAADEFFIQRDAALAEGTLVRVVGREVAAHQAEDGAVIEVDRRAAPEAADPDHEPAELLDEIAEQGERRAGADQVLDEKNLRALITVAGGEVVIIP